MVNEERVPSFLEQYKKQQHVYKDYALKFSKRIFRKSFTIATRN